MRMVLINPDPSASPCASCKVLYGATCCEKKSQHEGAQFPMTYAEALRISRTFGVSVLEAVDRRRVSSEDFDALGALGLTRLEVDGYALYLPRLENGNCIYLGVFGCTISSIKPHICALFPFSKRVVDNRWVIGDMVRDVGFCYGQDEAAGDIMTALDIFGMRYADLDRIERTWQRDIKTHAAKMRKLGKKK